MTLRSINELLANTYLPQQLDCLSKLGSTSALYLSGSLISKASELAQYNAKGVSDLERFNSIRLYSSEFLDKIRFGNLQLKLYSFGKLFILLLSAVLGVLALISLIQNKSLFDKLVKGNMLSANFLERLSKFSEFLLYYKISIIYNNPFYFKNTQQSQEEWDFNFYNISLNVTKKGKFSQLKESEFSHIYYQIRVIEANLQVYANEGNKRSILQQIDKLEEKLNTKDFWFIFNQQRKIAR